MIADSAVLQAAYVARKLSCGSYLYSITKVKIVTLSSSRILN